VTDEHITLGAVVEMIHTATLVHQRRHRRLHGAEDAGSDALPHEHAPLRARHVLQPLRAIRNRRPGAEASGPPVP
jgi:hypothetical protein